MFRQRKPVAKYEQVNSGDGIPHQKLSFDTTPLEAIQWRSYHLECIQSDPDRNGDLIGRALEYSDISILSDKLFTMKEFRPVLVDRAVSSSPPPPPPGSSAPVVINTEFAAQFPQVLRSE